MNDFLLFLDDLRHEYRLHADITYNSVTDWEIHVYRKGMGENGTDLELCYASGGDIQLVFAQAQVELKEKLLELYGGY